MFENLTTGRCYIIAEIGGNFFTFDQAKALVDAAKYSGVDCVKLQTFRAETIVSKKAMFDMENTGKISQFDYFKKHEIDEEMHKQVFDYIDRQGLDWFSTPSHKEDLDMLLSLGIKALKIGADDATNIPFLKEAARTNLPVFISTGMCNMEETIAAVQAVTDEGNDKVVIFHTVSCYPTHSKHVNLNVISSFKNAFPDFFVGFSDHTLTPIASIAAAAIGADVIERHFTIDKSAEGPDHMLSSTPDEMKYIVNSIREIEIMKGNALKKPVGDEVKNRSNNRKSVTAIADIKKGDVFSMENIGIRRPGHGIEPKHIWRVIGKTANQDISDQTTLEWKDV